MKRALGVAAIFLGVAAMSVGSAGFAAAQGSGGHGHNAGIPPGNNGSIKIENCTPASECALDPVGGKVHPDNDPHVSCLFELQFFGFDATVDWATVAFTAQPPSGQFQAVAPTVGILHFPFTGHGPGNSWDISEPYQLDVTGLKANPNQGYHIKVDVEVNEPNLKPPLPLGSDDKYKVFWYKPCSVPTTTTTTTVKHHETTTTTSTTVPPSTTSVPEEESTTSVPETTTTVPETTTTVAQTTTTTLTPSSTSVPEEGTTTTSTTLTPSSTSVPEEGTTTTSTTRPSTTTTTTSTSPPTTGRGTPAQVATTTTTVSPAAGVAPGQPQSRSGLAFTNGPTPSGAGTDLGFFSPAGSSHLPWLLLIVGGVLLSGAGTLSLTGIRLRKWISRA
jgi:hypothetical protein